MTFDFNLYGQSLEAELVIMKLSKNTIVVILGEFIFLDVEKFSLLPSLIKLQELEKLPSINQIVPIVFHLTFHRMP